MSASVGAGSGLPLDLIQAAALFLTDEQLEQVQALAQANAELAARVLTVAADVVQEAARQEQQRAHALAWSQRRAASPTVSRWVEELHEYLSRVPGPAEHDQWWTRGGADPGVAVGPLRGMMLDRAGHLVNPGGDSAATQ